MLSGSKDKVVQALPKTLRGPGRVHVVVAGHVDAHLALLGTEQLQFLAPISA